MPQSSFSLLSKGIYLNGAGQWIEVVNLKKNLYIYVSEQKLSAEQQKIVRKQPDYVLYLDLAELKSDLPQIKDESELAALKEEFLASMQVDKNPVVTITMYDGSEMRIELYPEIAPNTVNNFIYLAEYGFYNGLTFHRVSPGFVIQGGDPAGTGAGGPGYVIPGEFTANGFTNNLKHTRGVISMARSTLPDSAGSQFFIVIDDAPNLDGDYAAFGKVVSGLEVVDRIASVPIDDSETPLDPPKMRLVTVDTFGVTYPPPLVYIPNR